MYTPYNSGWYSGSHRFHTRHKAEQAFLHVPKSNHKSFYNNFGISSSDLAPLVPLRKWMMDVTSRLPDGFLQSRYPQVDSSPSIGPSVCDRAWRGSGRVPVCCTKCEERLGGCEIFGNLQCVVDCFWGSNAGHGGVSQFREEFFG